jgi:ankyrin repeat protein
VIQRKFELVDLLVENGADIDVQNADGRSPLMLAAVAGDDKFTDYLLDYGANKNLRDIEGTIFINTNNS